MWKLLRDRFQTSDRRGRTWIVYHAGRLGILKSTFDEPCSSMLHPVNSITVVILLRVVVVRLSVHFNLGLSPRDS